MVHEVEQPAGSFTGGWWLIGTAHIEHEGQLHTWTINLLVLLLMEGSVCARCVSVLGVCVLVASTEKKL